MKNACATFRQFHRRDFLRVGGASLCGVSLLDLLQARAQAAGQPTPKAKQLIVCWMAGGPPHTDMFDMKPESGSDYRGEFKPIKTNLPGLEICELMPKLAKMADKYTVIRSVTTMNKPGDHGRAPMYWLTGNPRLPSGTAKYPMYGSVVSKLRPGDDDLPTFTVLGKIDHHIKNSIASSFLGPAFNPFIFDPLESKDDIAKMLSPQIEAPAFARQTQLLQALDQRLRRQDGVDPLIAGLDKHQQTAFDMLRSPRLRQALDLSQEDDKTIARYKDSHLDKYRYPSGDPLHFLMARRLIEAGAPVVHFSLGYWDWHGENFVAGRQQIPMFDSGMSALLQDLDDRGLLDSTIVLALGEMGRKPKCGTGAKAGRDHWDYAQFVFAAGGGFQRGCVVGATDKLGEQVTDNFYKVESFGRTLYHQLGIDPDTIVRTLGNRPVKLIVEDAPIIKEALA
ncbi:DUF1501 domain-containing protein [Lignipirellula cremea]|uniref:DUF1501 domain-containing protein n=1 Tax=Lignipirellula cremea TaxID=2528010 RepID=A0A518DS41_9BACT|nr:DUF1501 domain-containing protein [Lignipirellula cremea]QDU94652.1 hypothetical protein Pla8534_24580 [Lignipirellula cremea]